MKFDTIAVHGAYNLEEALANKGSILEPVFLSSAQTFSDSNSMEKALAGEAEAWAYTRITNPSVNYLESTLALLEGYQTEFFGELSCHVTSSGMSAVFMATHPFLAIDKDRTHTNGSSGINIVASAHCYGGTFMLFSERYEKERGVQIRWVEDPMDLNEWESKVDKNTRFIFGEIPSNPSLSVFDIDAVAKIAHMNKIPLLVDSTLATPALTRPIAHGADIVIHSVSKAMCASGMSIAGALISKKNIHSKIGPDEMKADFANYVKQCPARDFGPSISPLNAILVLSDLRSLRSKVQKMSSTAIHVAKFLSEDSNIEIVNYPGLESCETNQLANKYMKLVDQELINAHGHLLSFQVKGGVNAAKTLLDNTKIIMSATDLGRIKTIATIPSISTHQQQGEAGRRIAHLPDNLIRLSVGMEDPEDIITDLEQALNKVKANTAANN